MITTRNGESGDVGIFSNSFAPTSLSRISIHRCFPTTRKVADVSRILRTRSLVSPIQSQTLSQPSSSLAVCRVRLSIGRSMSFRSSPCSSPAYPYEYEIRP